MFASKHKWFILVACSVGLFVQEAQADFDPSGKRRKPPIRVGPVGPKGPSGPVVRRDPLAYASIIAMKRPGEVGPVMKLAQLYRERDGSLEKAIKEWREKSEDSKLSADDRWGSLVTLAGLMKNDRRDADAMSVYEKAISQRPDRPVALVALARLKQDGGQLKDAFERYEKAFKLQREKLDREMTIRSLVELSIDLKDLPTAKKWHGELIKANGDSMAVRSEYARTLARKGHLEAAEKEFVEVVSFASGDNRTLPAALLELGRHRLSFKSWMMR